MTQHFEPEYEELVNRVVFQLSINKDHARERIDHLLNRQIITIDWTPDRHDKSSRVNYFLSTGVKNWLILFEEKYYPNP